MFSSAESLGVIEPGRLYTAIEARRRLQLGPKTWRELRNAGLRIIRRGRQSYVLSDDLIRAMTTDQTAGGSPR